MTFIGLKPEKDQEILEESSYFRSQQVSSKDEREPTTVGSQAVSQSK